MSKQSQTFFSQNRTSSSYVFTWDDSTVLKNVIIEGESGLYSYAVVSQSGGELVGFSIIENTLANSTANITNGALVLTTSDNFDTLNRGTITLRQQGSNKEITLGVIQRAIDLEKMTLSIDQSSSTLNVSGGISIHYGLYFNSDIEVPLPIPLSLKMKYTLLPGNQEGYFDVLLERDSETPFGEFVVNIETSLTGVQEIVTNIVEIIPPNDSNYRYEADPDTWVVNI